ncbi:hypothetical protein CARUB_v10018502mg [Capsella rubella]|uniref:Uncharacterized protein n=1 Tax=Capsella rubella TaxID=81985 RepID=R0FS41_9BRAS|nr:hypothetical protein CARUB_v10018502mg [Capsella rubella]
METVKVQTIGKEIIKPSKPSSNDLPTLQLSIMDQLIPQVYAVAFLFYTKDDLISQEQTSQTLKTSLSETLTKFHPFAGRVNGVTIDSTDKGAVFVDSSVDDCLLSDFLRSPDTKSLQQLLPFDAAEPIPTWPLLLMQCGGMAIGICMSHKLGDAVSISNFIQAWAATARGDGDTVVSPEFGSTKIYPPASGAIQVPGEDQLGKRTSITKRFVFVASKIEELRNKVASDAVPRPTRVQSLTSLIWKCVVASSTDTTREKALYQANNLRPKIPAVLSENLIGNPLFSTLTLNGKDNLETVQIVKELKKRSEEACFGWGSPVWVTGNVSPILDNVTVLVDSKDGQGVEAWVTLAEEEMLLFEQNTELLAFAFPNPSVLI